jgi:hypothetical protein
MFTYEDAVSALAHFVGSSGQQGRDLDSMRRAVLAAYRDLAAHRDWSYYRAFGTLATVVDTDTYALAADVDRLHDPFAPDSWWGLEYVPAHEWLWDDQLAASSGTPRTFTLTGHPTLPGRMAIRFFPTPDAVVTLQYRYQRRPRQLMVYREATGRASITSAGTAVTGTSTAFTSRMVGSVLRLSGTAASAPTGWEGDNPPAHESVITAVASATALTIADAAPATLAGVQLTISDPIDVAEGAMLTAFQRGAEYQASVNRPIADRMSPRSLYLEALRLAGAADNRVGSGRSAGVTYAGPTPLRYRGPIVWE